MKPYYSSHGITIFLGDCLSILGNLPKATANLFLTDPPYGIDYQNHYTKAVHSKICNDTKGFTYTDWATQAYCLLKENTALFAYTGWSVYGTHYKNLSKAGFTLKEPLIIQKRLSGTSDLYGTFQTNADWLLFAHKGRFKFHKTQLLKNKKAGTIPNKGRKPVPTYKTRMPSCWFGSEYPWSTENPKVTTQYRHPTIKTVELMSWLIQLTTDTNDLVIDPFMGTGTTLVAARQLNRRAIGIEIDKEHCKTTISRLQALGT